MTKKEDSNNIPTITEDDLKKAEVVKPPLKQIIIETDGSNVNIVKSDVSTLELNSICRIILKNIGGI